MFGELGLFLLTAAPLVEADMPAAPEPPAAVAAVGIQELDDLQKTMEVALRARRPEEFAFIAKVVSFVEQKHLPLKLVQTTFLWAKDKRPYPYVYFERAMRERAAKLGVKL